MHAIQTMHAMNRVRCMALPRCIAASHWRHTNVLPLGTHGTSLSIRHALSPSDANQQKQQQQQQQRFRLVQSLPVLSSLPSLPLLQTRVRLQVRAAHSRFSDFERRLRASALASSHIQRARRFFEKRSRRRAFVFSASIVVAVAAGISLSHMFANDPDAFPWPINNVMLAITAAGRFVLTMSVGAIIAADYALLFRRYEDYSTPQYKADRSKAHLRAAKWMLWLAQSQGGILVKAGQHIASLTYVVPSEFTDTLKVLQDKVRFRPFAKMKMVLLQDFNIKDPSELFSEFNELPLAAASLAQVHRAVTKDGQEVAVKLQYPDVANLFHIDMFALSTLAKTFATIFPDFQMSWIVAEFHKNLIQEFDFTNEATNCEKTSARFSHRRSEVRCPQIRWDLTSNRVLTMEFIHGVKVNNVQGLRALDLDPKDVRTLLSQAFAEMIFCHGVLHCDPHPGNIFVVRSPDRPNKPQLILLDHGLYRAISDDFRLLYCNLWKAMILGDQPLLLDVSKRLGVGQFASLFPLIFTNRTINSSAGLGESISTEERAKLRAQFQKTTVSDFLGFLESLPREILLASRISNLVRSIHQELGGHNLERFKDNATYAILGSHCIAQSAREAHVAEIVAKSKQTVSLSTPSTPSLPLLPETTETSFSGLASISPLLAPWFQLSQQINSWPSIFAFWKDLTLMRLRIWIGQSAIVALRWWQQLASQSSATRKIVDALKSDVRLSSHI